MACLSGSVYEIAGDRRFLFDIQLQSKKGDNKVRDQK